MGKDLCLHPWETILVTRYLAESLKKQAPGALFTSFARPPAHSFLVRVKMPCP